MPTTGKRLKVWDGELVNRRWQVEQGEDGLRLDVCLTRRLDGIGRAGAKRLIDEGGVLVNDRRVRKSYSVSEGDRIEVVGQWFASEFEPIAAPRRSLPIAYEDAHVVVFEKPVAMPSVPLKPTDTNTVVNELLAFDGKAKGFGYRPSEAGLLHRLDTQTSGLIMASRTAASFRFYRDEFQRDRVEKYYRLICEGHVRAPQTIDLALKSAGEGNRKMKAVDELLGDAEALDATTEVTAVRRGRRKADGAEFSLVDAMLRSGRRHQIRAHFAAIGHPLVGDDVYGAKESLAPHHLLHATALRFLRFDADEFVHVRSDDPTSFQEFLLDCDLDAGD
ncbi:MAG: RluA family pseudouridine synthase [Polyangiales bacterium]